MSRTAIIIGATGLTGGVLLEKLLGDDSFHKIKLFSRSSVNNNSPKIEEHIIDLFALDSYYADFQGDVVLCCIGTTKAKTPDKNLYRKIDYGIPLIAARLSRHNGIKSFIVISSMGANPKSKIFYNRTKGEMERDILQYEIPNTYILQPSLIGGNRKEYRIGERFAQMMMGFFGFMVPEKYKMIHPELIVKAMIWLSNNSYSETRISSGMIRKIAVR